MTGVYGNIRVEITPYTGPMEVIETRLGNILAVIDNMGYVRPLLNSGGKMVQIMTRSNNRVSVLTSSIMLRNGLNFYFDQPRPRSPQSPSQK